MNSAEEYASAARIVRNLDISEVFYPEVQVDVLVRELDRLADKAKDRDAYVEDLGAFAEDLDRSASSLYMEDYWTPPRGLLDGRL